VLQNVGLCICLWDVLRVSEGLIGQGDGNVNVNSQFTEKLQGMNFQADKLTVEFRLVVFRPYKGEILQGVILESDSPDGLRSAFEHIPFEKTCISTNRL
jgi:DNA-directed RNA polymerase III subunit RPC8